MKFVWNESLDQAKQMLVSWSTPKASAQGILSVAKDTRTLSLNVLAATGFHRSFSFKSSGEDTASTDAAFSYRDALSMVLDNAILLMLIPYRYLRYPIFPKSLQRIGEAGAMYKTYMEKMLEEETKALEQGKQGAGGLMTSFVRALDTHEAKREGTSRLQGLSVDEIFGNIFVINFAGHDTTANTLVFALFLLALEEKVQNWVTEEVRAVVSDVNDWEYSGLFPRLVRCRAILVS